MSQSAIEVRPLIWPHHTLDDLAHANIYHERFTADRAIEPAHATVSAGGSHLACQWGTRGQSLLFALVVRLGCVLQVARVLNGDLVAGFGNGAGAF